MVVLDTKGYQPVGHTLGVQPGVVVTDGRRFAHVDPFLSTIWDPDEADSGREPGPTTYHAEELEGVQDVGALVPLISADLTAVGVVVGFADGSVRVAGQGPRSAPLIRNQDLLREAAKHVTPEEEEAFVLLARAASGAPRQLAASPSGEHLAAMIGNKLKVFRLGESSPWFERRTGGEATVAWTSTGDIAVVSLREGRVTTVALDESR